MEDSDSKLRSQLAAANDLFNNRDYAHCRKYHKPHPGSSLNSRSPTRPTSSTSSSLNISNPRTRQQPLPKN